jgi:pimeloyl-ACP methyl ester carboxylesterase
LGLIKSCVIFEDLVFLQSIEANLLFMRANNNAVWLEYEVHPAFNEVQQSVHPRARVLLIMGLGLQLISWPQSLIDGLTRAGFEVITMDNRDVGLSTIFDHEGVPNLLWQALQQKMGFKVQTAYSLEDMAGDALAVLDACGVEQAHVLGMSMGGMIAQRLAILAPHRLLSLVSLMSSSGAKDLPGPDAALLERMFSAPQEQTLEAYVNQAMGVFDALASPGFRDDVKSMRLRVVNAIERSYHPGGVLRQMSAVMADSARAHLLHTIKAPTLVIHGLADPLVPIACGIDTAKRIPGAQWMEIKDMAHDLPQCLVPMVLSRLIEFFQ